MVNVYFFVISCESVYNCIQESYSLVTLDNVTFISRLNMKYHNCFSELVVIPVDLRIARLIYETISKDPRATIFTLRKECRWDYYFNHRDTVDLNIREDEPCRVTSSTPKGNQSENPEVDSKWKLWDSETQRKYDQASSYRIQISNSGEEMTHRVSNN